MKSLTKVVSINIIIFLVLFFVMEILAMGLMNTFPQSVVRPYPPPISSSDFFDHARYPKFSPFHSGFLDDVEIRKTSLKRTSPDIEVFFWGGSMTFGDGVADHETYPFYIEQGHPSVKTYNGGLSAFGPELNLRRLQVNKKLRKQIKNSPNPIGVYFFIDDHINRVNLNLSHTIWSNAHTLYEYKSSDLNPKTVQGDPLFKSNYTKYFMILILKKSYLFQLFSQISHDPHHLPDFSEDDIELTALVISELKNEFLRLNPRGRFYMVSENSPPFSLVQALRSMNIEIDFKSIDDDKGNYQEDGHYTKHGNFQVAKEVMKIIGLPKNAREMAP